MDETLIVGISLYNGEKAYIYKEEAFYGRMVEGSTQ